jgi:hypothetical protein
MFSTTLALRLSTVVFISLALVLPAQAAQIEVDPRPEAAVFDEEAPNDEVAAEGAVEPEVQAVAVAKPVARPKAKRGVKPQHRPKHDKSRQIEPSLTAPPKPKIHFPSLDNLGLWLGRGLLLILVVGALGTAGVYRWRLGGSTLAIEDLNVRRRSGEAQIQRLKEEVGSQKRRADQADDGQRRAVAANQDLAKRLAAAEAEGERLRSELSWATVRSQMLEMAQNRLAADPDVELDMEDNELPDDPSEEARLAEEAKRLKDHLATLRKAGKRKQSQVVFQDVLNGEEQDVFWSALKWTRRNKLYLHPQVSMGEFLRAKDGSLKDKLFRAFNARRVDFLVSDWNWKPVLVIEHQGSGHFQGNWRLHDAVKRLVLGLAGLPLVETFDGQEDDIIHEKLDVAFSQVRSLAVNVEALERRAK